MRSRRAARRPPRCGTGSDGQAVAAGRRHDVVDLAASGLSADETGAQGAKVKNEKYSLPPEREAEKVLEGEPEEVAAQVVKLLREEAKII